MRKLLKHSNRKIVYNKQVTVLRFISCFHYGPVLLTFTNYWFHSDKKKNSLSILFLSLNSHTYAMQWQKNSLSLCLSHNFTQQSYPSIATNGNCNSLLSVSCRISLIISCKNIHWRHIKISKRVFLPLTLSTSQFITNIRPN